MKRFEDRFDLPINRYVPGAPRYFITFVLLFLACLVVYGNSFKAGWHFDDLINILNQDNIKITELTWDEINKSFYFQKGKNQQFNRPIPRLTFALNYYIGGDKIFGYHVVNFIIHYLNSCLLFLLFHRLLRLAPVPGPDRRSSYSIALFAAFLWAIHPLQVTAVTYIVQRMTSLYTLFYLAALYFFALARTAGRARHKVLLFLLCVVSILLSLGSKQTAIMIPISIVFLEVLLFGKDIKLWRMKTSLLILFFTGLLTAVLAANLDAVLLGLERYRGASFTVWERLLTEPRVLVFYLSQFLYPIESRFTFLYEFQLSTGWFAPWTTFPAILAVTALLGLAFLTRRTRPLHAFCLFFFFLNHIPEGTVLPLDLVYEHRNYLPSTFLTLSISVLFIETLNYFEYRKTIRYAAVAAMCIIAISIGHTTYARNGVFKDDLSLWKDNAIKSPNLSRVHNNLGVVYFQRGMVDEAIAEFSLSIKLDNWPKKAQQAIPYENLGLCYYAKEDFQKAETSLVKSLELYRGEEPPSLFFRLGFVRYRQGDLNEAHRYVERGLRIGSRDPTLHFLRSVIRLKNDRLKDAEASARTALKLDPGLHLCYGVLGEIARKRNRLDRALRYWKLFSDKNPDNITAQTAVLELSTILNEDKMSSEYCRRILCRLPPDSGWEGIFAAGESEFILYQPDIEDTKDLLRGCRGGS